MVLRWRRVLESVGDLWGWITGSKRCETKAAESDLQTQLASIKVDQLLDELGFSEEDIYQRTFTFFKKSVARALSARIIQNREDIDRIFIGSQREGIGLEFINDLDVLQIYKFVQCVENKQQIHNPSDIVFVVDNNSAPPGHTFLWLQQKGSNEDNFSFLGHALVNRKGRKYFSAHKFMSKNDDMFSTCEGLLGKSTKYLGKKGPSLVKISNTRNELQNIIMKLYNVKDQTMDYVRGFPCEVKGQTVAWQHRKRNHDWPPTNVVSSVASMTAVVVPTGQKGTKRRELQWRICFPAGELVLFNSISNTHKKIYVVLKTVGKLLLRPIDRQITSYVMKNVLFWEAEKRPIKDFTDKSIVLRIQDALRYLKKCICQQFLPYYMIPERNLLVCKIPPETKEGLTMVIDNLITNGPILLLKDTECLQNKYEQLNEVIQQTKQAQQLAIASLYLESTMTTHELVDHMVEMFFKETSDINDTVISEKIKNIYEIITQNQNCNTPLTLTSIQPGFPEDDFLVPTTLKQLNIETCAFPPHYFLNGSTHINAKDSPESMFNNREKSANVELAQSDNNLENEPMFVSKTSIKSTADRTDECHLAPFKETTVLQHQKPNTQPETERAKKEMKILNEPSNTTILAYEQTKLLTEEVKSRKEQVKESNNSFSEETKLSEKHYKPQTLQNPKKQTEKCTKAKQHKKRAHGQNKRKSKFLQKKKQVKQTSKVQSKESTLSMEPQEQETPKGKEKHQVTENKSEHHNKKEKCSRSNEYNIDNELEKCDSDAKHTGRPRKGKSHLSRRERLQNQRTGSAPPEQTYDWTNEILPIIDIILLMSMVHPRYIDILIFLSNPSKYLKAFWILVFWISVFCFHTMACVNKWLEMFRTQTEETVIKKRPPRTWKKLKQLCKQTV